MPRVFSFCASRSGRRRGGDAVFRGGESIFSVHPGVSQGRQSTRIITTGVEATTMNCIWAVAAAILLAMAASPVPVPGAEPFFPLGLWYEGGVGEFRHNLIPEDPEKAAEIYRRDFADMAAHGINAVAVPNSPPEHHQAVLDAAGANGLKVILELGPVGGVTGEMVRGTTPFDDEKLSAALAARYAPVMRHPALLRLQLLDEPSPESFDSYGKVAAAVRRFDEKSHPFCCLIGSDHFEQFLRASGSDVAAYDFYPFTADTPRGDRQALHAFRRVAEKAGRTATAHGADAWAVIQAHSITGGLRFPTTGELRCMTHLALATGAQGVWWFLYQTQILDPQTSSVMAGLIDGNLKGSDRWEEIGRLTQEIKSLVPLLTQVKPVADDRAVTGTQMAYLLAGNDQALIYAVNMDTESTGPVRTSVRIAGADRLTVSNAVTGRKVDARETDGWVSWQEDLPPGGGRLYRFDPPSALTALQGVAAAARPVVFACPHNAAKSVMAAAYFNDLAARHGLSLRAASGGTHPIDSVATAVVELMRGDGLDVSTWKPRALSDQELAAAHLVVSLGCDELQSRVPDRVRFEAWNDIPPPIHDLPGARDSIRRRVEDLVARLAAEQAAPGR